MRLTIGVGASSQTKRAGSISRRRSSGIFLTFMWPIAMPRLSQWRSSDPYEEGIAIRVRGKVRFYETDFMDESPPVKLRPMRDGHFTTGQGLSS